MAPQLGGLKVTLPVRLTELLVRFDVHVLVRLSAKDGALTVLGLMFNRPPVRHLCWRSSVSNAQRCSKRE
eukprot:SAG11_NODE_15584_length_573_cov_0.654008_2_plen_69_part_01